MSSTLEIANIALAMLGERPLVGLDDDSDVARQVNVVLEPVIDAILDSYEWNCATYRADLNLESDAPAFDWTYSYTLPTDPYCLRVLALDDIEEDGDRGDRFKVEGRHLLANTTPVSIKYIGRPTDMGQLDKTLYRALSWAVAADLAMGITGSADIANRASKQRDEWVYRAMLRNDREGSIPLKGSSPLATARSSPSMSDVRSYTPE